MCPDSSLQPFLQSGPGDGCHQPLAGFFCISSRFHGGLDWKLCQSDWVLRAKASEWLLKLRTVMSSITGQKVPKERIPLLKN